MTSESEESEAPTQEFVLRAFPPSRKEYHVAQFNRKVHLDKFEEPVEMFQKNTSVVSKSVDFDPMNQRYRSCLPTLQRERELIKKRGVRQPIHLQDGGEQHFTGTKEGGQSSSYVMLLMKGNNEFSAIPISDWYKFRPNVKRRRNITLDEAEAKLSKQRNKWQKSRSFGGTPASEDGDGEPAPGSGGAFSAYGQLDSDEEKARGEGLEEDGEGLDFDDQVSDDEGNVGDQKPDDDVEVQQMLKLMEETKSDSEEDAMETTVQSTKDEEAKKNADKEQNAPKEEGENEAESTTEHGEQKRKREADETGASDPPAKRRKENSDDPEVQRKREIEERVKKVLLKKGSISAPKLAKYFKRLVDFTDPKAKAEFLQIVNKVATMKDAKDGSKVLILRAKFRA
mmetsp:Transcript_28587/g.79896  ORF Transcript_28587/g.79896 Transcript_28587/m.79896 type:complete len:397 (+) Transcript_28587:21-1211(+)